MLKNFDAVKEQLKELADIVNAFKSEAVQLRIVELVLGGGRAQPTEAEDRDAASSRVRARGRRKVNVPAPDPAAAGTPPSRGRTGRLGGKAVLTRLYQEKFFETGKTINDIVQHADAKMATKLKQSDISGGLARYVRDKKLSRNKNADNQYEYINA
jgi:hypothetical protein